QVEPAVPVHVGEGDGRAAGRGRQAGVRPLFGEMARAVVQEERVRPAEGGQNQVQVAVAVDIGEGAPSRVPVGCRDSGALRDVYELPSPAVAIERVGSLRAGE